MFNIYKASLKLTKEQQTDMRTDGLRNCTLPFLCEYSKTSYYTNLVVNCAQIIIKIKSNFEAASFDLLESETQPAKPLLLEKK